MIKLRFFCFRIVSWFALCMCSKMRKRDTLAARRPDQGDWVEHAKLVGPLGGSVARFGGIGEHDVAY